MFDEFLNHLTDLISRAVRDQLETFKSWLVDSLQIEQAPEVMNLKEAAHFVRLHPDTFRDKVNAGVFSSTMNSHGQPRFLKKSLIADLEANEHKSTARLEGENHVNYKRANCS